LVKDSAHIAIFEKIYAAHFRGQEFPRGPGETAKQVSKHLEQLSARHDIPGPDKSSDINAAAGVGHGPGEGGSGEGHGGGGDKSGGSRSTKEMSGVGESGDIRGRKTALDKGFNTLTADEIKILEAMIPQIARRLASRMKTKIKKEHRGRLDFRRTFRRSLAAGGVPLELFNRQAIKEKPVIFVLCDVSSSVWQFCC